jgi:hypothetical protein
MSKPSIPSALILAQPGVRLLCYQLRIGFAEFYQNVIEGRMDVAAWALARCRVLNG